MKMKKWEKEYQDYKQNPEKLENEIEELKEKVKTAKEDKEAFDSFNREEQKELEMNGGTDKIEILEKMLDKKEKIKENFPQVENIVEYREKLQNQLKDLPIEIIDIRKYGRNQFLFLKKVI